MKKAKKKTAKRSGRPPMPVSERRTASLFVRLTREQLALLQRTAKKTGLGLSDYVRKLLSVTS